MKSKTDLSGMWEFCLDGDKKGMEQESFLMGRAAQGV